MDISAMDTNFQTGMAVAQAYTNLTKRVLEDSKQSAEAILQMLPDIPAMNPPHLGRRLDTYA